MNSAANKLGILGEEADYFEFQLMTSIKQLSTFLLPKSSSKSNKNIFNVIITHFNLLNLC